MISSFKEFLGQIPEIKKKEGPVKLNPIKKVSVKDVGLWEPWLKRNERKLKGKIEDGPARIPLPVRKGITETTKFYQRLSRKFLTESIKKDLKDFEKYITQERGWEIEEGKKHKKYYHKQIKGFITVGNTISDWRALKNNKARILRSEKEANINQDKEWTHKV